MTGRKHKKLLSVLFFSVLSITSLAQEFETGKIGVSLSGAGRVRIFAPNFETQQIDRSSFLFAASEEAVFNYNSDAFGQTTSTTVENSLSSDFEIFTTGDNSFSDMPPDIEYEIHVHGWQDQGFIIVTVSIKNLEADTLSGTIGLEVLPIVDGEYGTESVAINDGIVTIWRPTDDSQQKPSYTGYKLLNSDLVTMIVIDYFEGYDAVNSDIFGWLNAGSIDTAYSSGNAGSVILIGGEVVDIASQDSVELHFAVAVSDELDDMIINMDLAEAQYSTLSNLESDQKTVPNNYLLLTNYPNPFNPTTTIQYTIPVVALSEVEGQHVSLRIYNILGREVATLVNEFQKPGIYKVRWNASNFSSGVYYYRIITKSNSVSNKMILVK